MERRIWPDRLWGPVLPTKSTTSANPMLCIGLAYLSCGGALLVAEKGWEVLDPALWRGWWETISLILVRLGVF